MRRHAPGLVLAAVFAASLACTSTPPPVSCTDGTQCFDVIATSAPSAAVMQSCSELGGTYSASTSCPTQDRVARCTTTTVSATGTVTLRYAFYPPFTTAQIEAMCASTSGLFQLPSGTTTYEFQAN